jgi:hypothetical protein
MSSLSTVSTSTSATPIAAMPRGKLPFSPLAILEGIHSTLVEKSYSQKPNVDASILERFGRRIVERVQHELTAVISQDGLGPGTNWERRVFKPIIATFDIGENLGVCQEDAEYISLLVTALSLAFELLLLADRNTAGEIRTFLARSFDEFFVEPEICRIVDSMLDAEHDRLSRMPAEATILRAIQNLRNLLPDIHSVIIAWNASMLRRLPPDDIANYIQRQVCRPDLVDSGPRISRWSEEATSTFFEEAGIFAPVRHAVVTAPYLQVKVFLKYGCCLSFNFITLIDHHGDCAIMHMCNGLRMELKTCPSSSSIIRVRDRVSVRAPEGSNDGFIGTLFIPPDGSYHAARVENIMEERSDTLWTIIDTATAIFEIVGDNYQVRSVNIGSSAVVEHFRE